MQALPATRVYTVESVLQGHPDKVCDQIADGILDSFLQEDKSAKVAIECLGAGSTLVVAGEVHSRAEVDVAAIARRVYQETGYQERLRVQNHVQIQSSQLRQAVEQGAAGDQAVVYGYACAGHTSLLPWGLFLAHAIARGIDELRHDEGGFLPDGKVQVTVVDRAVDTLVVSVQHPPSADLKELRTAIMGRVVAGLTEVRSQGRVLFNHRSRFLHGGFPNDTGLTGRKQAVDTYGGTVPHGGGSFSGKDPTKVDRSAAYMARFVAKSIVGNELAPACLVMVAYAFGEADPVMIHINTGDERLDRDLLGLVKTVFDFRPSAIIERLNLRRIRYRPTATYGHFTDPSYPWEAVVAL